MLPSFCNQEIVRIRPGEKESRGSTIPDWSPDKVNKLTIKRCSVQPATTSLSQDGRVLGISDGMTLYAPANADIIAGDRIQFGGNTYTINGDPRRWPSATGGLDHIQCSDYLVASHLTHLIECSVKDECKQIFIGCISSLKS